VQLWLSLQLVGLAELRLFVTLLRCRIHLPFIRTTWGDVFASQFGVSSVTFTISYVVPGAGGFIVGTFSGQLRTATDELVNISNGSFQLPIN